MEDSLTRAVRDGNEGVLFDELDITIDDAIKIVEYNRLHSCLVSYAPGSSNQSKIRSSCCGLECRYCPFDSPKCTKESAIAWLQLSYSKSKNKTILSTTKNKYFPKLTEL